MRRKLGPEAAEALKACLADLRAAESITDVLSTTVEVIPGTNGNDLSLRPPYGFQIVIRANHVNNPVGAGGEVDWYNVSRVKIMDIVHND